MGRLRSLSHAEVEIQGGFWRQIQDRIRAVTLPIAYEHCKRTGRIEALRLEWKQGEPQQPHPYWDSDVAKWIEAASYSLTHHPDPLLKKSVSEVVDLVVSSQQPDGYLNSYISSVEPENRFKNLYMKHELYCAGHLIEAAIAWFTATSDRAFLDCMCTYADYIVETFGTSPNQLRGYPGHQEIELALIKLFRMTGKSRYLDLARFFVDERGTLPSFFDIEAKKTGELPLDFAGTWQEVSGRHARYQAHLPVREQRTAEGHAVRAGYFYTAVADLAAETDDEQLAASSKALWENVTQKRMYLTGGVGSSNQHERFTFDYDLPNETGYCETCASVSLIFWAHRMLSLEPNSRYADVMERALYNGVLSGVSLSGDLFFYANPLQVYPPAHDNKTLLGLKPHFKPERQPWFDTACCPPNLARLLLSLGNYIYSQSDDELYVHLYVQSEVSPNINGNPVSIKQDTDYPWNDTVTLTISGEVEDEFTLAFRIPGWCRGETICVSINGTNVPNPQSLCSSGYLKLRRQWRLSDTVELRMPMAMERVYSHPNVRTNCGKVALQRGPIVYCLEEIDNGPELSAVAIPRKSCLEAINEPALLGGIVKMETTGLRLDTQGWDDTLYQSKSPESHETKIIAIPYFAWCNRSPGEMAVWIREV